MANVVCWIIFTACSISLISGLEILPRPNDENEMKINANASFTLTCKDKDPVQWNYMNSNRTEKVVECYVENGINICNLTLISPDYLDTGYYTCALNSSTHSNFSIYIYVFDGEHLIVLDSSKTKNEIKIGADETLIPCKPTAPEVNITLEWQDENENLQWKPIQSHLFDKHKGFSLGYTHPKNGFNFNCCGIFNNISHCSEISAEVDAVLMTTNMPTPQIEVNGPDYLMEGCNVTLNCSVTTPNGVYLRLEWNDDEVIPKHLESSRIQDLDKQMPINTTSKVFYRTLTIHNLTKNHQLLYTCKATEVSNKTNESNSSITLSVKDKFAVELENNDEKFYEFGKTYSIGCDILTKSTRVNITWSMKTCQNFTTCDSSSSFEKILQKENSTQNVTNEENRLQSVYNFVANQSMYLRCEANNSLHSVNSTSFYIVTDTNDPYGFAINKSPEVNFVGNDVKLTCIASKYTYHSLTWNLNGSNIKNFSSFASDFSIKDSETNFSFVSTLSIHNAQNKHSGNYSCQITLRNGISPQFNHRPTSRTVCLNITDKPAEKPYILFLVALSIIISIFVWFGVRVKKKRLQRKIAEILGMQLNSHNILNKLHYPSEKLKSLTELGSGEFGIVMRAEAKGIINKNTTTTVAVKMVKSSIDPIYFDVLIAELKIMMRLGGHPNILRLLGACIDKIHRRQLSIISEYCRHGSLHDFLLKHKDNFINQVITNEEYDEIDFSITSNVNTSTNNGYVQMNGQNEHLDIPNGDHDKDNTRLGPIKTSDLICWSYQIARGMEYLAKREIYHGDLATRNVLLSDNNIVKICDFGMAERLYYQESYKRKGKDSPLPVKWMAPESIKYLKFSIQSDVWSFGVLMWELFELGKIPYHNMEIKELCDGLEKGHRLSKPKFATIDLHGIMQDCWDLKPTLRPTFTNLSQRLEAIFKGEVQPFYAYLNDLYMQMSFISDNSLCLDYLTLINAPNISHAYENVPRYVNLSPLLRTEDYSQSSNEVELQETGLHTTSL